jgi:hypothetical protein
MSDIDERPLSAAEINAVRELLDNDKRARWLWASLRVWAIWVASFLGAWIIGWESLSKVVKMMAGR